MYDEHDEGMENGMHSKMGMMHMRDFKIAMLEKKEKILRAKLEFIEKMKDMIKNMPEKEK